MGAFVIWGILVGILFHWIIWYEYRCGKINKKERVAKQYNRLSLRFGRLK